MRISYQTFSEKAEYQSLLVINEEARWRETLYFTFYTPWDAEEEQLYAGRYMADVHLKSKDCQCVVAFDFHRWTKKTIDEAISRELPPTAFKKPLRELLDKALAERERTPDGFSIKVKG